MMLMVCLWREKTEILMRGGRENEKKWEVCVCVNFRHQICWCWVLFLSCWQLCVGKCKFGLLFVLVFYVGFRDFWLCLHTFFFFVIWLVCLLWCTLTILILFVSVGSSWTFGKLYESDEHLGAYGQLCCRVEYAWKEIFDSRAIGLNSQYLLKDDAYIIF